ncbi:MAG: LPS-assembly protein LptD [Ignavibacteriales bacterium]|nr:LPS-assembly protein LptD [Ignavibacteriales bacterium]
MMERRIKLNAEKKNVGILIILIISIINLSSAQISDTLSFRSDTTITSIDTLKQPSGGIDSVVNYTATDSIIFTFDNKNMKMFGKSDVKHKELSLKSEIIEVNWNTNDISAYGVLDSVKAKTSDSLKQRYTGMPVMKDGGDVYEGWKIAYNFKSQKGRVTLGETEEDQGYYQGEQIKKVDKDMMFIANGFYSTCELGHPHFYFYSPEMRVTIRDKIVARPIYLYIADVPLFALPFGVFPSQGGRRSGILAPAFVDKGSRGTGLEHFGYYFALSDYTDLAVVGDWLTSGTWRVSPNFRYVKRYNFSGSLSGYYQRAIQNEPRDPDYVDRADYFANLTHNQTFNPTTRLDVNFTFASSENFRRALTLNEYLNQEITSNATLSKSWEGTGSSMSINVNRRQNLINGSITNTLPSISYSHSQSYPFRFGRKNGGGETDYAWYEMIGMSYGASGQRVDNRTRSADTLPFNFYQREGINHSLSFNAAPKAGYFTISPYFSYNEKWYDKSSIIAGYDTSRGFAIAEDRKGFEAVRSFNTGVSMSTKLYGILQPPIPGVAGLRHTVLPSITYNYQPDFSDPKFGYYIAYKDKLGQEQKFNRFQKEIYGGAPAGEQQAVSLSLGNIFEMKTSAKDTTEKEQKYQLLNLNASVGYNFVADSMNLSDLSLSYRTSIGEYLGISGSSSYRFYEFNRATGGRVNKYLFESGKFPVEMTAVSLSLSTSLRGERKAAETQQQVDDSARVAEHQRNQNFSSYRGIYDTPEPDFSIPWSLSLSFNFSQSQENPARKFRSANVSGSLDFNLTENWKFTASSSYDLVAKQLAAPQINISRDLHCWLMNFSWTPLGVYSGYRFEIRVKAPQLQDIKVTKQNNDRL